MTHRCLSAQAQNALLTKDGDVRYGHIGLQRAGPAGSDDSAGRTHDVHSVAVLLYRMSTGVTAPDMSLSSDELLLKIRDPSKRKLISGSLLAKNISAEELRKVITEIAPFDVRKFSKLTRGLAEIAEAAKIEARRSAKIRTAAPCLMICEPGDGVDC